MLDRRTFSGGGRSRAIVGGPGPDRTAHDRLSRPQKSASSTDYRRIGRFLAVVGQLLGPSRRTLGRGRPAAVGGLWQVIIAGSSCDPRPDLCTQARNGDDALKTEMLRYAGSGWTRRCSIASKGGRALPSGSVMVTATTELAYRSAHDLRTQDAWQAAGQGAAFESSSWGPCCARWVTSVYRKQRPALRINDGNLRRATMHSGRRCRSIFPRKRAPPTRLIPLRTGAARMLGRESQSDWRIG